MRRFGAAFSVFAPQKSLFLLEESFFRDFSLICRLIECTVRPKAMTEADRAGDKDDDDHVGQTGRNIHSDGDSRCCLFLWSFIFLLSVKDASDGPLIVPETTSDFDERENSALLSQTRFPQEPQKLPKHDVSQAICSRLSFFSVLLNQIAFWLEIFAVIVVLFLFFGAFILFVLISIRVGI